MAPNVKGWSDTLQEFLSVRGYLRGEVSEHDIWAARAWFLIRSGHTEMSLWERSTLVSVSHCNDKS